GPEAHWLLTRHRAPRKSHWCVIEKPLSDSSAALPARVRNRRWRNRPQMTINRYCLWYSHTAIKRMGIFVMLNGVSRLFILRLFDGLFWRNECEILKIKIYRF
ncbi:hypothetical protein ACSG94_003516, partial [Edwardsiella ictaluri]